MDFDFLITIILFVIFYIGPAILRLLRKQDAKAAPEPVYASLSDHAERTLDRLKKAEAEARKQLAALTPDLRPPLAPLLEGRIIAEAARLRELIERLRKRGAQHGDRELEDAQGELLVALEESEALLREFAGLRTATRALAALRGRHAPLRRVADRLAHGAWAPIADFAASHGIEPQVGPPVAVIADDPGHSLKGFILGESLVAVPPSAERQPWRWSQLGGALGTHLLKSFPEAHLNAYQAIAGEAEAAGGGGAAAEDASAQTARVLFLSWLPVFLSDAAGASLYGPGYLAGTARALSSPSQPARTTMVRVGNDGTVHPAAPAHLRIHLIAAWLEHMGLEREAAAELDCWDEWHGRPAELRVVGRAAGVIPMSDILGPAREMQRKLFELQFDSLAGRRLIEVPGLDGWERHQRQLDDVAHGLRVGRATPADVRQLVAAATAVALAEPDLASQVTAGLAASLDTDQPLVPAVVPAGRPKRQQPGRTRARRPARVPRRDRFHPSPQDLVEAMLLHDIVLTRHQGRPGR